MKFGICRGLDDFEAIICGAKAGADYFETGFGCLVNYSDERFYECKAVLEDSGLKCIAANGFIPGDMALVGECVDYSRIEEYLNKGFERASVLGVKKIVLGSGRARSFPEGFSAEKANEQLLYFLRELAAPRAEKIGASIVLEPLRFCESSMIYTVEDGVKIAELSGAGNVFGLADLYHVYGNNDSISGMRAFENKVKHSHIAEPVKRLYPKVSDSEEVIYIYREFLSTLEAIGCETCSIEAHTDDFCKDVQESISFLKSL